MTKSMLLADGSLLRGAMKESSEEKFQSPEPEHPEEGLTRGKDLTEGRRDGAIWSSVLEILSLGCLLAIQVHDIMCHSEYVLAWIYNFGGHHCQGGL